MPANQAPVLDNFTIRDGAVQMRGGMYTRIASGSALNIAGYVAGLNQDNGANMWLMVGTKASGTSYPWQAYNLPASSRIVPSASFATDDGRAAPYALVATTGSTIENVPGPRWVQFGITLYGLGLGSATLFSGNGYSIAATNLLTYNMAQSGLSGSATMAAPHVEFLAPRGGIDLTVYQNRLWILGGADTPGGSSTHSNNTLYFTVPGLAGIGTNTADWRDPISGITNKITLDTGYGNPGMGLARTRSSLLIFCRNSIFVLRGSTTSSYTITRLTNETGCIDPRSILETDSGVYFMSDMGLMITDGVTVKNVSGTLGGLLKYTTATNTQLIAGSTSNGYTLAKLSDGSLLLGSGSADDQFGYLFNRSANAWTRLTSRATVGGGSSIGGTGLVYTPPWKPTCTFAFGSKAITTVENYTFQSNNVNSILVPEINARPLHDVVSQGASSDIGYNIPAQWMTRFPSIVGTATRHRGQAKRFFLDSTFMGNVSLNPSTGWNVVPIDSTNTAMPGISLTTALASIAGFPAFAGSGGATDGYQPSPKISRDSLDFPNEVDDMSFYVTAPGFSTTTSWTTAQMSQISHTRIFGLGLEYQPGRQLSG